MKLIRKTLRWALGLFLLTTVLSVVLFRFAPVYITPLMVARMFQQAAAGEEIRWEHDWVPLSDIAPHLPVAVMASEDQRFLLHHGFDFDAIEKAAVNNIRGGRRRGASTITQQTAKNVFLLPDRTWLRKGLEAYFTVLIELTWSKQRIMEVYLNSIETGDGIYGAEAVARAHFGKKAAELSRADCALIAATLPNPLRFDSGRPTGYMHLRQRQIMRQMKFIPSFPKEGERYDPNTASGGIYRNKRK